MTEYNSSSNVMTTTKNVVSFSQKDDIADHPELKIAETIVNCFIVHVIGMVGCLGNILIIIVFCSRGLRDATNIILVSLAVADLVYLATLCLRQTGCIISHVNRDLGVIYDAYVLVYLAIPGRTFIRISIFHVVVISVERFMAVFVPFHVALWVTPRNMALAVTGIYVFFAFTSWPYFIHFTLEWSFDESANKSLPTVQYTRFYLDNSYGLDLYASVIRNVVISSACYLLVAIFSLAIAVKLHKMRLARLNMTSSQISGGDSSVRVSRMLLVVCLVYIIAGIPANVRNWYLYLDPTVTTRSPFIRFLVSIEELAYSVYSASNFVIYVLMSRRFYDTFILLGKFKAKSVIVATSHRTSFT